MQVLQKMDILRRQLLGTDLSRQLTSIDENWKSQLMAADVGLSARGQLRRSTMQGEVQASMTSTVLSETQLSTSTPAITPEGSASDCMEDPDNEAHSSCTSAEQASGAPMASTDQYPSSALDRVQIAWA